MKLGLICGSHRPESQSGRITRFIEARLIEQKLCDEVWRLDLWENPLPLWPGDDADAPKIEAVSQQLISCDGFVVVSPEWHGMSPAGLKNFFLFWGQGELAHKPALLVAVSAGAGGAYPIAELRMSSYKNNRLCYLPEHLIVRNAEKALTDDDDDPRLRERLDYALRLLREYAEALGAVRASGAADLSVYKSGM